MRFRGKAATVKCFEVGRGCRGGLPALGGEGGGGGLLPEGQLLIKQDSHLQSRLTVSSPAGQSLKPSRVCAGVQSMAAGNAPPAPARGQGLWRGGRPLPPCTCSVGV